MKETWEATGLLSGDHECFCLDVTPEELKRHGVKDPEEYDDSRFNLGTYRLYPSYGSRAMRDHCRGKQVRVTVTVEVVE